MKKLKAIGYWNSRFNEDRFIWPQELVKNEMRTNNELKLVTYLSKGNPAIYWKGYSGCRICKETLGTKCLTDGVYIWPEKLEHYVICHNVSLPDDFVKHAKKNKWKVKKIEYKKDANNIDWDYWIKWCNEHRNLMLVPRFEFKKYRPPLKTGKGKLTPRLLNNLFATIESLDVCVNEIEMDNRKLPEGTIDVDEKGEERLWSAKVKRQRPLIIAKGVWHYGVIATALVFKKSRPIFYCNHKNSVSDGTNTRWCPEL